jgi:hypothetical protein
MRLSPTPIALFATLLLAACASGPRHPTKPRPQSVRAAVSRIDASLTDDRKVVGDWHNEQASSTYQAWLDGGEPVYIVETAGGDRSQGYAVNKYYYRGGHLFYYRGQGNAASATVVNPKPTNIDIQIAFKSGGSVKRAIKKINGRATKLEPGEMHSIREHAHALAAEARAEAERE